MEHVESDFSKIVAERLSVLGQNAYAIEKAHNLPPDAVRNVLRGAKKSGTPLNRAREICAALGLEFYIGPPRDTGPVEQVILDGRDFAHIPLHQASLAAGDGASNEAEEIVDHLAFRRSWLTRIGVSASNAVLARARGDSMLPGIHCGDMVLIDRSKREVPVRPRGPEDLRPAPIYAFLDSTGARVKRIERPEPDLVMLLSDNPSFPPEVLTGSKVASLDIIGKVMWWGHTNRE
ncbi:MAG: S24 family peptidase [Gemmobacter sp.]|nr:S24 family peptidase [Gemmobacter sp.]